MVDGAPGTLIRGINSVHGDGAVGFTKEFLGPLLTSRTPIPAPTLSRLPSPTPTLIRVQSPIASLSPSSPARRIPNPMAIFGVGECQVASADRYRRVGQRSRRAAGVACHLLRPPQQPRALHPPVSRIRMYNPHALCCRTRPWEAIFSVVKLVLELRGHRSSGTPTVRSAPRAHVDGSTLHEARAFTC